MTLRTTLALLAALAPAAAPAAAVAAPPLRADDQARLAQFDAALGMALRQVLTLPAADPSRRTALAALSGAAVPAAPGDLAGEWSCRTIKLGKTTPATAYSPFRCRITVQGDGATLAKLTGSQRVTGEISAASGLLTFAGVGYIAGDTPPAYADLPATIDPSASPQRLPVVGVIEMTAPGHARLMMPSPWLESDFDLLELTR